MERKAFSFVNFIKHTSGHRDADASIANTAGDRKEERGEGSRENSEG